MSSAAAKWIHRTAEGLAIGGWLGCVIAAAAYDWRAGLAIAGGSAMILGAVSLARS